MTLSWTERNRTVGVLEYLGILGLTGLLIARFVPVARLPFWGCMFRDMTGWPCLGCGLTRAADRFSHGNILGALSANPLGTLAAAAFALAVVLAVLHLAFKIRLPRVEFTSREAFWLRVGLGVALALNWAFVALQHRHPGWWSALWS